MKLATNDHYEM